MDKHEKNKLPLPSSLRDVLERLNQGVSGVIVLVDDMDIVHGILTDGDVRRALLNGATLESLASGHMNTSFTHGIAGTPPEDQIKLLSDKIRHLPVLDEKRRLVDLVNWVDIWRKPVMEPHLGGNELIYVSDCITSNWISSQGSYVSRFEQKFAIHQDTLHALTTMNCTCALHVVLVALGIGQGDEVIVPDLTFAATANAVIHAGARPVFADVHPQHWTLDPSKLSSLITPRTKAIIPVHLYGFPCDMDPLIAIARKHNLYVIEDCAEALGTKYKGRPVGTIGDAGCFSFFSNKVITTGEGGMIVTNNTSLHEKLVTLRDHGMSKSKRYWHEFPGFNYRMTNLQAAVGLAQMEQIDQFLHRRAQIASWYNKYLQGIPGLALPSEESWALRVMWLFTILLPENWIAGRETLIKQLLNEGIETRPMFYPLHVQPAFGEHTQRCPVSTSLSRRGLSLPSSIDLEEWEVAHICKQLLKALDRPRTLTAPQAAMELYP